MIMLSYICSKICHPINFHFQKPTTFWDIVFLPLGGHDDALSPSPHQICMNFQHKVQVVDYNSAAFIWTAINIIIQYQGFIAVLRSKNNYFIIQRSFHGTKCYRRQVEKITKQSKTFEWARYTYVTPLY